MLRSVLKANFKAPIGEPSRVLDVGCGTGQWAFEMAEQFPAAEVVGFDLVAHRGQGPGNYRLVRGNLLTGLPFADRRFDFVHQRLLVSGVPVKAWPSVVADLVRVTRPGGWIELVETALLMKPEGPATARVMGLLRRLFSDAGLDTLSLVIDSLGRYLRQAGCVDVQVRTLTLPVGSWGGPVGTWGAAGGRAMLAHLAPVFEKRYGVPGAEFRALMSEMHDEYERYRPTWDFRLAYAQRPVEDRAGAAT